MVLGDLNHDMADSTPKTVAANLAEISARIDAAAQAAGREASDIVFTAVSKKQPDDRVDAALATGHRVFGENRVQEAQGRWARRRAAFPDLHLRLVGPLQTNKAEDAVALFDAIESVDRPKLVDALAKAFAKVGRTPDVMIQVNTGEEPQKAGVAPSGLDDLIAHAKAVELEVAGLMCIPPADEPAGPHFALLAKLAARSGLRQLSMGMSADFETAIAFGATHIRVGSAAFGERLNA